MIFKRIRGIVLGITILANLSNSTELTVSKIAGGQFTTIQSAVDASQSGDVITILDTSVYDERVVIRNKNGLTLQSCKPEDEFATRPVISYQDITNVGPKTEEESFIDSLVTFDHNGAVFIYKSKKIVLRGIKISGASPAPYCYDNVWDKRFSNLSGNCGVTLKECSMVTISNCDIADSYYGIYIKENDTNGIFALKDDEVYNRQYGCGSFKGFNNTGNHLIEFNRIHNNSWGMFLDAIWNQGSVIRFNKFYENHHTDSIAQVVKAFTIESNQPGGAILLKYVLQSPLAIYNNTFWHNNQLITCSLNAAIHHLVLNNIFGSPFIHTNQNPYTTDEFMEAFGYFRNRLKNCTISAQADPPGIRNQNLYFRAIDPIDSSFKEVKKSISVVSFVRITDELSNSVETGSKEYSEIISLPSRDTTVVQSIEGFFPGASIIMPYVKEDNVRWIEMKFKSTNPEDSSFLIPDWSDSVITKYLRQGSWTTAPICNRDGSICDIGMASIGSVKSVRNIIPLEPAYIVNGKAVLNFELPPSDSFPEPKFDYFKIVKNIPSTTRYYGPDNEFVKPENMEQLPLTTVIKPGKNTIEIPIDTSNITTEFGFIEMLASSKCGINKMNTIGFIPYRRFNQRIDLSILDVNTLSPITAFKSGEKIVLRSVLTKPDSMKYHVDEIRLFSGEKIFKPDGSELIIDSVSTVPRFDTIVLKNAGIDAFVMRVSRVKDSLINQSVNSSNLFTIEIDPTGNRLIRRNPGINNSNNKLFTLYTLNGRKAGLFTGLQIKKMQSLKQGSLPSGTYFTVSDVKNGNMMRRMIVIP